MDFLASVEVRSWGLFSEYSSADSLRHRQKGFGLQRWVLLFFLLGGCAQNHTQPAQDKTIWFGLGG